MALFIALSTIGIGALLYIFISLCRESKHVCPSYCEVTAIREELLQATDQGGNARTEQQPVEMPV